MAAFFLWRSRARRKALLRRSEEEVTEHCQRERGERGCKRTDHQQRQHRQLRHVVRRFGVIRL